MGRQCRAGARAGTSIRKRQQNSEESWRGGVQTCLVRPAHGKQLGGEDRLQLEAVQVFGWNVDLRKKSRMQNNAFQ